MSGYKAGQSYLVDSNIFLRAFGLFQARSTGTCRILSYDRDFDKLGVRRLEPKDILSFVVE